MSLCSFICLFILSLTWQFTTRELSLTWQFTTRELSLTWQFTTRELSLTWQFTTRELSLTWQFTTRELLQCYMCYLTCLINFVYKLLQWEKLFCVWYGLKNWLCVQNSIVVVFQTLIKSSISWQAEISNNCKSIQSLNEL